MCPDRCARFALLTLFANLHCFPFWWYIQNYLRSLDIPWDLLRSDVENVDNVDKINTVGNVGIASEHWWTIWSNMRQKLTKSWKLSISTTLQTLWNVHNWRYGYVVYLCSSEIFVFLPRFNEPHSELWQVRQNMFWLLKSVLALIKKWLTSVH